MHDVSIEEWWSRNGVWQLPLSSSPRPSNHGIRRTPHMETLARSGLTERPWDHHRNSPIMFGQCLTRGTVCGHAMCLVDAGACGGTTPVPCADTGCACLTSHTVAVPCLAHVPLWKPGMLHGWCCLQRSLLCSVTCWAGVCTVSDTCFASVCQACTWGPTTTAPVMHGWCIQGGGEFRERAPTMHPSVAHAAADLFPCTPKHSLITRPAAFGG